MSKKRTCCLPLLGWCAWGLVGLTACVDSAYDLSKDVDMTVTIGGNLALPGSDTEEITLKKIFDLDDDCLVQADPVSGDYRLAKGTEATTTEVGVDRVNLDARNIEVEKSVSVLHFVHRGSVGKDFRVENKVSETSKFSLNKSDVTPELVSLRTASMDMESKLCLDFRGNERLQKLGIEKGFRILLPAYMTVESSDPRCTVVDRHIVEFNADMELRRNTTLQFDLRIVEMDFSQTPGQGLVKPGVLSLTDEISIMGKSYVYNRDLERGDIDVTLSSYLDIQRIELTEVRGVVDPNIELNVNPVKLDHLPDFLTDDQVRIHLTDPRIYLTVTNPSPVDVNFQATLAPVKKGTVLAANSVHVGHATNPDQQIRIPGNTTNYLICIHQLADKTGLTADAYVSVPNLTAIVEEIPDEIQVRDIHARALPREVTLNLGRSYKVQTDYELQSPLQFDEGTQIVYADTIDGWAADTKDLEIKQGLITLDADNTVPMDMVLTVDAIDPDGRILTDVVADVDGTVAAGRKDQPATSSLTVTLHAKSGSFKHLDGIIYRVAAVTGSQSKGITLNQGQLLLLKNIRAKVIGGVTVDFN